MYFGAGALAIASHTCLVVALSLLIWRVITLFHDSKSVLALNIGLLPGVAMFAFGLIVERNYYIAARVLRPQGYDLWQEHPAPEVLSVVVLLSLYAMKVPLIYSLYEKRRATGQVTAELGGLACLWCSIVWVLF